VEALNQAYVKSVPVRTEDRLVMIGAGGGRKFINVLQIQEVISIIKWEDEEYLVWKTSAMFSVNILEVQRITQAFCFMDSTVGNQN
jgi:hypothetical protein